MPTVREVFGAGLSPPQKQGCGLTAGERLTREEIREQRQDESRQGGGGPNLAQRPPTRREARTPDTGQEQNTAGGGQRGQGGKHRCRPTGKERGRRTASRGERESNARTRTAKARRQAIVADSRQGEQEL